MQEWPSVGSTVSPVVGGGDICGVMHWPCDGAFLLLFWMVSRVRKGGEGGLEVMEAASETSCEGLGVPRTKGLARPGQRQTGNRKLDIEH